ncbi:hypothetical protein GINT2_000603 [Glugoides intestinalis]
MDRTSELNLLLNGALASDKRETKFYEQMYMDLQDISSKAARSTSYKTLLLLDNELNVFVKKCTDLFDNVSISGSEDMQAHFEGVKYIVNREILETSKELAASKKKAMNVEVELEPQKPQSFRKVTDNQLYEQETKRIVESAQYEITRQRIQKIEAVQKAIQENLLLQDERIDNISMTHTETTKVYDKLSTDDVSHNGSFFRRTAFTIIMCLSFVLLFVHFFYKYAK